MKSLLQDAKILKISNNATAGVTVITSDTVDTQGFNGVCFIVKLGTVVDAGTVLATLYQGALSAMTDEGALTGATVGIATTSSDSEQSLVLDIVKPEERYLRIKVARTTENSEIDSMFAILYNPRKKPVTQPATIDASTQVVSPVES